MCEYCENLNSNRFDNNNTLVEGEYEDFSIYKKGTKFVGFVAGEGYGERELFYCPMCGKRLSEVQHEKE